MKTIQDKLRDNEYRSRVPYFTTKENREGNQAYHTDNARLEEEFKKDLFKDLGITNNPKAEQLYAKAWDLGHSTGYSDVYIYACDLVELIE